MPFSAIPAADLYGPCEETPATQALLAAVRGGDLDTAAALAVAHWEELWWAIPPALTGEIVACFPPEVVEAAPDMRLVVRLNGSVQESATGSIREVDLTDDLPSDEVTSEQVLLRAISLRLAGRPWDALGALESSPDDYAVFGHLREDTSGGRLPSRRLSVGLIAILGERHGVARQQLGAAARALNPVRFPWVPRAASALLALTHALEANHPATELWLHRASALPRTRSWSEDRSDDHLDLARMCVAIDRLDLATAQRVVESKPSPFDHAYLWPFAAEVYSQYYLLKRQPQAAHSMWREILETVPAPTTLQGAARRVLVEVPLRLALATGSLADAADQMARSEGLEGTSVAALADYVAGNVEEALALATSLLPQAHTDPRMLMRLTGIVAACHHSLGNVEARDHTLDQFLARADMLGTWSSVAFSPLPLRPLILAREIPDFLRDLLVGPHAMGSPSPAIAEALTPAEVEAFKLVASGRNRKEISAMLHLSENTVKTHLRHIYRKLGVSSRVQAMERASEVRALILRSPDQRAREPRTARRD